MAKRRRLKATVGGRPNVELSETTSGAVFSAPGMDPTGKVHLTLVEGPAALTSHITDNRSSTPYRQRVGSVDGKELFERFRNLGVVRVPYHADEPVWVPEEFHQAERREGRKAVYASDLLMKVITGPIDLQDGAKWRKVDAATVAEMISDGGMTVPLGYDSDVLAMICPLPRDNATYRIPFRGVVKELPRFIREMGFEAFFRYLRSV